MAKECLYFAGYRFTSDSHIDGAMLGGLEGAMIGCSLGIAVAVAIKAKRAYDINIGKIPEEQAKESARRLFKRTHYLPHIAVAVGMLLGSAYPQKTFEIVKKTNQIVSAPIYKAGRALNKLLH